MKHVAALLACLAVAGCNGLHATPSELASGTAIGGAGVQRAPHFAYVIVMIQENRSFDNLFATYPGADGATKGKTHTGAWIGLKIHSLIGSDIGHTWQTFVQSYDKGKMDGFDLNGYGGWGGLGRAG